MEQIEKQETVFKQIDPILEQLDTIIPPSWTKAQVASVLGVYLEIYK